MCVNTASDSCLRHIADNRAAQEDELVAVHAIHDDAVVLTGPASCEVRRCHMQVVQTTKGAEELKS